MYLPPHFKETRVEELHRVITEYPLGVLVLNGPNGLDPNHLPFELNPNAGQHGHLLAHVARCRRECNNVPKMGMKSVPPSRG